MVMHHNHSPPHRTALFRLSRRSLLVAAASGLAVGHARAQEQNGGTDEKKVRIGVLADMSAGFAAEQASGSVIAARLAAADAGGRAGKLVIEVIAGDHKNQPEVGAAIVQRWIDNEAVDAIVNVPNTAVTFTVGDIVRDRNRVLLSAGIAMSDLAGTRCSANTVQWVTDAWELGHSLARAVMARGGSNWFFLSADHPFGADLQAQMEDAVRLGGGSVAGSVHHPAGTKDFTSFLLQAQTSGANVLALASAGTDAIGAITQASEYGLSANMTVIAPAASVNVLAQAGLKRSAGMLAATPFYWDLNAPSRAFAARFAAAQAGHVMPNQTQAGVYAAVAHYVKAVTSVGSADDGRAVVEAMKRTPTDDALFGRGNIRADGRKLDPLFVFQTKTPDQSTGPWDLFRQIDTVSVEQAFRPIDGGTCKLTLL